MMKRWIVLAGLASLFFWGAVSASATTYYIDYASGNDANSGTSTASPWQHAPGMSGCAGACASNVPQPGDQFIFKGGVTWPITTEWEFHWAGASGNPIYIGVDKTWFTGSAWTRPIMDAQNANPTRGTMLDMSDNTSNQYNYITIDNIEWKGLYWGPNQGATIINIFADKYITIENCYFHGWSHGTLASGTGDSLVVIYGYGANEMNLGTEIKYNVFDGSDTTGGGDSGSVTLNVGGTMDHNIIRNVDNGFRAFVPAGGGAIYDNQIGPINLGFIGSASHENCIHVEGGGNPIYIYNNVVGPCVGETLFIADGGNPVYVFNNVIYSQQDYSAAAIAGFIGGARVYIWNNTIDMSADTSFDQWCIDAGGSSTTSVTVQDNFCITAHEGEGIVTSPYSTPGTLIVDHNAVMGPAEAKAAGFTMSSSPVDQIPNSTCSGNVQCPVGAGLNLSSSAAGVMAPLAKDTDYAVTYDMRTHTAVKSSAWASTTRPATGAWDAGAYNFSSSATSTQSSAPEPPTGLNATVQ